MLASIWMSFGAARADFLPRVRDHRGLEVRRVRIRLLDVLRLQSAFFETDRAYPIGQSEQIATIAVAQLDQVFRHREPTRDDIVSALRAGELVAHEAH